MRWTHSLRGRLIVVMVMVFTLGAVNVAIYLLDLDNDIRSHVFKEQVDTLLAGMTERPKSMDIGRLPLRFSQSDWRYALYGGDGTLIAASPVDAEPLAFIAPGEVPPDMRPPVAARVIEENKVLVIQRSDWAECEELCQIFQDRMTGSAVIIGILAVISIVSIYLLSGWALASVRRAATLAKTIGKHTPERRIPLDDLPNEILPLVRAANTALDRLADAYQLEKRFTVDAAHELRTPLAVLDLRLQKAEMGEAPDWRAIRRDMEQMRHLASQLLEMARIDHENLPHIEASHVAIARILRQAAADVLPGFEEAGRPLLIENREGLMLAWGGEQLRQALRGLLVNALKHGQGVVQICLEGVPGQQAQIHVRDEGPAASPVEAEQLFDRFRKGTNSRGGTGLGLAIVRQVMTNLGGTVSMATSGAFSVTLTLPLSDEPKLTAR